MDGELIYKGCGRDWVWKGHWSKLTMDEYGRELMPKGCGGKGWDAGGDLCTWEIVNVCFENKIFKYWDIFFHKFKIGLRV